MEHILSLSYGKDSLACLGAIEKLGWPLDRIVHAEIWATDTIPADLPSMVEFKAKADKIIKEQWGIEVEHYKANQVYEDVFYRIRKNSKIGNNGKIYGFPSCIRPWCTGELKQRTMRSIRNKGDIHYLGIAADEAIRIRKNTKQGIKMPLVECNWDETHCWKWCEENDLLSPIYTTATRGGCWFCHNQSVNQLRLLRKNYPEYWALMLRWDKDSPATFHADGHTIHDFDKHFRLEDEGYISAGDKSFRWKMLDTKLSIR